MERVSSTGGRGRARALAEWRRQLELQAYGSVQPPVGGPTAGAGDDPEPVAGRSEAGQKLDAEHRTFAQHREADAFEADISAQTGARKRLELDTSDSVLDGEQRAGRHLRLQEARTPSQPTQNLVSTLASQRKHEVRANRRVAAKSGSKGGAGAKAGFSHLPHQGLWKAEPLPPSRRQKPPVPNARGQIAFT